MLTCSFALEFLNASAVAFCQKKPTKLKMCLSLLLSNLVHLAYPAASQDSSCCRMKLQPVAKMLRHFVPKMALLTSMVRKLPISHSFITI